MESNTVHDGRLDELVGSVASGRWELHVSEVR
jgi:hypothetical protein